MPQPSSAGGLLSNLQSFAVLDRLVGGPVGWMGARSPGSMPHERRAGEPDEPLAAAVPLRRDGRPRGRGGRRGPGAGGGGPERPA